MSLNSFLINFAKKREQRQRDAYFARLRAEPNYDGGGMRQGAAGEPDWSIDLDDDDNEEDDED